MQSAHLVVIDALMSVGAMEMVTAAKTNGSVELPGSEFSWEDALLQWVIGVRHKPCKDHARQRKIRS